MCDDGPYAPRTSTIRAPPQQHHTVRPAVGFAAGSTARPFGYIAMTTFPELGGRRRLEFRTADWILVVSFVFPATRGEARPGRRWSRPGDCLQASCFLYRFRCTRGSDDNGSNWSWSCHGGHGGGAGIFFAVGGVGPELLLDAFEYHSAELEGSVM